MSLLRPAHPRSVGTRGFARTAVAAAAAGSMLMLAACGGDSGGGGGETTTLSFFSWESQTTMGPIIDAFEEAHPDITIDFSYTPPVTEYIQTLQTRLSAGTAADVFVMAAENKSSLIENEAILPLTDEDFMANIAEFNKQTYSGDGVVYAMSVSSWGAGIVYNTELTDAAGMTEPPATWEELLDLMEAIKETTGVAPFYDNNLQEIPFSLQALLGSSFEGTMSVDEQIFAGDATFEEIWTGPVETWYEPYQRGLISGDILGLSGDHVVEEFINGRVAMLVAGPWYLPTIREGAPDLDFALMPIPAPAGQEAFLPGAASPGYAINAATDKVDAARTFLTFLGSPEAVEILGETGAAIPTTTDFEPTVDPAFEPIVDQIRDGKTYLAQISWPRFQDTLTTEAVAAVQRLVLGQLQPADVGANLDRELAEQQR